MRVLWVTSGALPEANSLLNQQLPEGGSWLVNTAKSLAKRCDISLSIAFPANQPNLPASVRGGTVTYYPIEVQPTPLAARGLAEQYAEVIRISEADIVHIFGTEHFSALAAIEAAKSTGTKSVVSVQGLVSFISEHYLAGLPVYVQQRRTIRDLLRRDSLTQQQRNFLQRGTVEKAILGETDCIIGRTGWDEACVQQLAPSVGYRRCNEILREPFYKHSWSMSTHVPNRIFVTQGYYPLKGIHWLLRALPIVIKRFPLTELHVGGPDPLRAGYSLSAWRRSSYDKYLLELIEDLSLSENVRFLGPLDEEAIIRQYLEAHVFVLPSSIENSSNSLGEAQLLGIPAIASFVGGNPDFMRHGTDGFLYQSDAYYMLAHYLCLLFSDDDLAVGFSVNARAKALEVYDEASNTSRLRDIYEELLDG